MNTSLILRTSIWTKQYLKFTVRWCCKTEAGGRLALAGFVVVSPLSRDLTGSLLAHDEQKGHHWWRILYWLCLHDTQAPLPGHGAIATGHLQRLVFDVSTWWRPSGDAMDLKASSAPLIFGCRPLDGGLLWPQRPPIAAHRTKQEV